MFLLNYISLLAIFFFSVLLSFVIFGLASIFFYQTVNEEKNAIYECGFSPFSDARSNFDVKFYLISILYIVFDLEIIFLIPGILSFQKIDLFGLIVLLIFLTIVWVGFCFEWNERAMNF